MLSQPIILKKVAKTLLAISDKPVLVMQEPGSGKIIWSGLNLPYHAIRYNNPVEVKFFQQLVTELVGQFNGQRNTQGIERVRANKIVFNAPQGQGILFKEQNFSGWQVKAFGQAGSQRLTIYKAGPANPGYMYISVPDGTQKVEVEYKGYLLGVVLIIFSSLSFIWLLDYLIGFNLLTALFTKIFVIVKKPFRKWWEKDSLE